MTPEQARRASRLPKVRADADRYGTTFLSVDRSIALHTRLGLAEPWNEWEWPRRLAVLDRDAPPPTLF